MLSYFFAIFTAWVGFVPLISKALIQYDSSVSNDKSVPDALDNQRRPPEETLIYEIFLMTLLMPLFTVLYHRKLSQVYQKREFCLFKCGKYVVYGLFYVMFVVALFVDLNNQAVQITGLSILLALGLATIVYNFGIFNIF